MAKQTTRRLNENRKFLFPIMLALGVGLAPFFPEPHIWGKLKWLWGGAVGMQPKDYFDLFFHGIPWVVLAFLLVKLMRTRKIKQ